MTEPITTVRLRELLEETPGPWKWTAPDGVRICDRDGGNIIEVGWGQELILSDEKMELIAAAPDLAAEVIRLREALEQIRDLSHPELHRDAEDLCEVARRALGGVDG